MKIAITGKGGVGKSTLSAVLALLLAQRGQTVLALDADPDANLAAALGFDAEERAAIVPISKQIELIEERTGAKVSTYGQMFKINPEVSDVAETYAVRKGGVDLLVLGAIQSGGGGCACAESTFVRALVCDLVLFKDQAFIMDMEAGVEHLGRATAQGVDVMIVVVEPGQRSIDCATTVTRMAKEIGVKRVCYVGSKVQDEADEAFIREKLPAPPIGLIPMSAALRLADRDGVSALDAVSKDAGLLARYQEILAQIEGIHT